MQFIQKIKSGIKKFSLKKKYISFLFLGFLIFFLFSLPLPTSAGVWDVLVGGLTAIPTLVFVIAMAFVLLLSQTFAFICSALLSWVLSPSFVAISYTSPVDRGLPSDAGYLPGNPIIKIGLDITKSSVNLFLVLFLVYIAVAIALRLGGEGNAKKMLARLILIALLVNFAPLLVGLIVDASNIMMNGTLAGIGNGFSDTFTQFSVWSNGLVSKLLRIPTFAGQMGLMAQVLVMVALNFAIGLGLLLYAAIFIFRYIVIWILVIFSPIAFVSLIHPFTKKMVWDLWWKQLWEWSFIGAFLAYFLYLGAQAIRLIPSIYQQSITMSGFSPEVSGMFSQSLPYFVVLVFLYLGFTMGLQTGAMGANAVIGLSKRGGKWVGSRVWKGASTWMQEKAQIREKVGAVTKKWEELPVARWFLPERMRKYAEMRPAVDEAQKKLSIHSSPEISHKAAVGDIYGKDAVGGLMEVIDRGDSNDWVKEHARANGINPDTDKDYEKKLNAIPEYRQKMARLLQIARSSGRHNRILRSSPRLAEFAIDAGLKGYEGLKDKKLSDGTVITARKQAIARAVEEARPEHVKNWEEEDVFDKDVVEASLSRGRGHWQAISSQIKRGDITPLRTIGDIYKRDLFPGKTEEEIAKAPEKELAEAWGKFEKTNREQGRSGFFDFLTSARAKEQGWNGEKIIELATGRPITLPKKKKGEKLGKAVGIGEDERAKELFEEMQSMKSASEKKETKKKEGE